jgi:hypothetical protein
MLLEASAVTRFPHQFLLVKRRLGHDGLRGEPGSFRPAVNDTRVALMPETGVGQRAGKGAARCAFAMQSKCGPECWRPSSAAARIGRVFHAPPSVNWRSALRQFHRRHPRPASHNRTRQRSNAQRAAQLARTGENGSVISPCRAWCLRCGHFPNVNRHPSSPIERGQTGLPISAGLAFRFLLLSRRQRGRLSVPTPRVSRGGGWIACGPPLQVCPACRLTATVRRLDLFIYSRVGKGGGSSANGAAINRAHLPLSLKLHGASFSRLAFEWSRRLPVGGGRGRGDSTRSQRMPSAIWATFCEEAGACRAFDVRRRREAPPRRRFRPRPNAKTGCLHLSFGISSRGNEVRPVRPIFSSFLVLAGHAIGRAVASRARALIGHRVGR